MYSKVICTVSIAFPHQDRYLQWFPLHYRTLTNYDYGGSCLRFYETDNKCHRR